MATECLSRSSSGVQGRSVTEFNLRSPRQLGYRVPVHLSSLLDEVAWLQSGCLHVFPVCQVGCLCYIYCTRSWKKEYSCVYEYSLNTTATSVTPASSGTYEVGQSACSNMKKFNEGQSL